MDTASVHSDEDILAPMRDPGVRRGAPPRRGPQSAPGSGPSLPRKSIAIGARGAALLSHALAATRRRSRGGDPTAGGVPRLENTYRMRPKEEERFSRTLVRPVVMEAMEELLSSFDYAPGAASSGRKACELAQAIRDLVKDAGFERYKLVVDVCLFQRAADCAAAVASRAVWAVDCGDCFVECRYQNRTVAAVATVHALYFE